MGNVIGTLEVRSIRSTTNLASKVKKKIKL